MLVNYVVITACFTLLDLLCILWNLYCCCFILKHTHTHTRTHTHTYIHTHAHARTHARMHLIIFNGTLRYKHVYIIRRNLYTSMTIYRMSSVRMLIFNADYISIIIFIITIIILKYKEWDCIVSIYCLVVYGAPHNHQCNNN